MPPRDVRTDPPETFLRRLSEFCAVPLVVCVVPRSGPPFDAIVRTHTDRDLCYELWSDERVERSGELRVMALSDIVAIDDCY